MTRWTADAGMAREQFIETGPRPAWLSDLRSRVSQEDLPPELVDLALEVVALEVDLEPEDAHSLLLMLLACLLATRQGSTRIPVADSSYLVELLEVLLGTQTQARSVAAQIRRMVDEERAPEIIGRSPTDYRPVLALGQHLYIQRMFRLEDRLCLFLAPRLGAPLALPEADAVRALQDVASTSSVPLSGAQQRAIRTAVLRPFALITGGPGTGKTSIVLSILRALVRLGLSPDQVALAAPTGKAAKRLSETIRRGLEALADAGRADRALLASMPQAETLHRLLGFNPKNGRFFHDERRPLVHRAVVVDESSMIDIGLMERLVAATPADRRLVLLGDADQLPSVDAGAVFRDLAAVGDGAGTSVTRLDESFRMNAADLGGRNILQVSRAMNRGDADALFAEAGDETISLCRSVDELRHRGIELLVVQDESGDRRRAFIDQWLQRHLLLATETRHRTRKIHRMIQGRFDDDSLENLGVLFQLFRRSKLLTVTRGAGLPTGAQSVNAELHARWLGELGSTSDHAFEVGEPVLMLRNDYERQLFNGDQGLILSVAVDQDPARLMAVFVRDAGPEAFQLGPLRHSLELAHAMTVHKAQGSEYDTVALLLPEADNPLMTREIVYTAVTRARSSVVIVGTPEALRGAIGRKIRRYSGLADKLRSASS